MTNDHAAAPSRRRSRSVALGAVVAMTAGLGVSGLALATSAGAVAPTDGVYSNTTSIPMTNGALQTVDVPETGLTNLSSVAVTLHGVTDDDLSQLVVWVDSPNDSEPLICDSVATSVNNQDYNFSSDAGTGDAICSSGDLSNLRFGDPAGTWDVGVEHSPAADTGSINGGFTIAMTAAPAVTTQPDDALVTSGQPATFTAAATGLPTPTVQWQKSTDGSTFTDIAGATTDTLTIAHPTTADNNTFYQAVYTSTAGTATTDAHMLTVNASAPAITTQPVDTSVLAGTDAIFTAAASSDPASTVQWQSSADGGKTFSDIQNATAGSYTVSAPTLDVTGSQYRAVFTNRAGTATTNPATLTVTGAVPSEPGNVFARQTGVGQVTISWSPSASAGNPATIENYTPGWGGGQMGNGDTVAADQTSDVFNGLAPGTYTLSVAAVNAAGTSTRTFHYVTVVAPSSTPTLAASATRVIEGTHVLLSGQAPASTHVTLQRQLPGGKFVSIATVSASNFGHYAFTVPAGHTAVYRTHAATGTTSPTVKVTALDKVTLRAVRTSARHYTLSGDVRPSLKGQLVKVYAKKSGGAFVLVAKVPTNKLGHWTVAHVFAKSTYTFKAVSASVPLNAGNTALLTTAVH